MIQRIIYITAFQIVLYTMGIPMLVAYEVGANRLKALNSRTSSIPAQVEYVQPMTSLPDNR
ncbi:MAG: hypothetical protein RLZZ117_2165 [Cyanobacteriota bacterium]|jgi:hypothetical protein